MLYLTSRKRFIIAVASQQLTLAKNSGSTLTPAPRAGYHTWMTREDLIEKIETFLSRTGMSARRFSLDAAKDSGFFSRLKSGKTITLAKMERIDAFMRENNVRQRKKK